MTVYVCIKYGSRFKVVCEYKPQIYDKRNNCWFLKKYVIWHVGTGGGWVNWKGDSKAIGKGHSGGQASIEGETC